jgi:2-methylisocitrate lyase-like PEP mutase family enzyme
MANLALRRQRFRELHERDEVFVIPNPWDVGSARLLESLGFEALATTSAGFAWSIGRMGNDLNRDEVVDHVAALSAAVDLPINVDAERCYADTPAGVAETVMMLAEAGAAGFSIEDWDAATKNIDPIAQATERVSAAVEAAHRGGSPMFVTGRAENHIRGVTDFDDTLARLAAYRDAGVDALFAPGLTDLAQIRAVVDLGLPVNVIVMPNGPTVAELGAVGVRRVSTGGSLAKAAYGALLSGARELVQSGTTTYSQAAASNTDLQAAFT